MNRLPFAKLITDYGYSRRVKFPLQCSQRSLLELINQVLLNPSDISSISVYHNNVLHNYNETPILNVLEYDTVSIKIEFERNLQLLLIPASHECTVMKIKWGQSCFRDDHDFKVRILENWTLLEAIFHVFGVMSRKKPFRMVVDFI